jgi:hypothetical protein
MVQWQNSGFAFERNWVQVLAQRTDILKVPFSFPHSSYTGIVPESCCI